MNKELAELRYKTSPLTTPDSTTRTRAKKDVLVFLAFLILVEGGGAIIGISTANQIATW